MIRNGSVFVVLQSVHQPGCLLQTLILVVFQILLWAEEMNLNDSVLVMFLTSVWVVKNQNGFSLVVSPTFV